MNARIREIPCLIPGAHAAHKRPCSNDLRGHAQISTRRALHAPALDHQIHYPTFTYQGSTPVEPWRFNLGIQFLFRSSCMRRFSSAIALGAVITSVLSAFGGAPRQGLFWVAGHGATHL